MPIARLRPEGRAMTSVVPPRPSERNIVTELYRRSGIVARGLADRGQLRIPLWCCHRATPSHPRSAPCPPVIVSAEWASLPFVTAPGAISGLP
jgi:hypothetical protein